MFYKDDTRILTLLLNIYSHLKKEWDYVLVICGYPGTGKSKLGLNLIDTWNELILNKPVSEKTAIQMASDYRVWLKNFKTLEKYDINVYDEGGTSLDNKSWMNKLSKAIVSLFRVFRKKSFLSVIIIDDFFSLNKYVREKRVRGIIWVNKRGHYHFYTQNDIKYLNAFNERRLIKSMEVVRSFHSRQFPDYQGVMLEQYDKNKDEVVNQELDRAIGESEPKPIPLYLQIKDKVKYMRDKENKTFSEIAKELSTTAPTIQKAYMYS